MWREVEALSGGSVDFEVTTEVRTVTTPDPDPVEIPEDATRVETGSDVVTVWRVD